MIAIKKDLSLLLLLPSLLLLLDIFYKIEIITIYGIMQSKQITELNIVPLQLY